MPDNTIPLKIPGARGKISVSTNSGIFFKVMQDGEGLKRKGGRWVIPLRNGNSGELRARGMLPGFQRLMFDGTAVHEFGADVPKWLRYITLLPLLLVILDPFIGMILGVILVFLNVLGVTNAQVPLKVRAFLPFTNTVGGAAIVFLANGLAAASTTT